MHFGMHIFATDTTLQPADIAGNAERLGFDSVWLPEHSHIPTSRVTPWGGIEGRPPLPEKYWRCHDVPVALMAMAAATTTLKLATGITLLAQRDPIWTAKELATVDRLSGGRLMVGLAPGWNIEEMNQHGVAYKGRRELMREKALIMKALWTQDEASFEGELLTLESSWSWPKPAQVPHPPIIMGGKLGPKHKAHMVEYCDGWVPFPSRTLGDQITELHQALEDAGRDPAAFSISIWGQQPKPGTFEIAAEVGADRVLFDIESNEPARVLEDMERAAEFGRANT